MASKLIMMKWLVGFRVLLVGLPGLAVLWNVSIFLIEWGSDLDKYLDRSIIV